MGVGNHVIGSEHDKYEQKYSFYTTAGVGRLLKDFHKLKIRAYEKGDIAAVDIKNDLFLAIESADLTEKQRQAIHLLYIVDMDNGSAAKKLGIDSSTLSRNKKAALRKIVEVFRFWNYLDY